MKSWFGRTHEEYSRQQFRQLQRRAKVRVDSALDKRVNAVVAAMRGSSGEKLNNAITEAVQPVRIGYGTNFGRSLMFRDTDDYSFWPHPAMIQSRLTNRLQGKMVPEALRQMDESGWLADIFAAKYVDAAMAELGRGGILRLSDPRHQGALQ